VKNPARPLGTHGAGEIAIVPGGRSQCDLRCDRRTQDGVSDVATAITRSDSGQASHSGEPGSDWL